MNLDPQTDLKLERTVAVPRELLWECWTTPEHIKHFFIPKPHSIVSCEIDLKVGGKFNTLFDVDGNQIPNNGVFLEVVDGEKLVFTDAYTEEWKPSENPFMTAIILFEDLGNGSTTQLLHVIVLLKHDNNMKIWVSLVVGERLLINLKPMPKRYK